jgi:hypothetical protein
MVSYTKWSFYRNLQYLLQSKIKNPKLADLEKELVTIKKLNKYINKVSQNVLFVNVLQF